MSTQEVKFTAVGDITLGDHPMCAGFGAYSRFKDESPIFPFEKIQHIFQKADLSFGNLECAHSYVGLNKKDYHSIQMRGDPGHIQGLVEAGLDVVNVANNHTMQHGKEAFLDSIQALTAHDIKSCGASPQNHLIAEPSIIEANGISIAFLGYSLRPRQYFEYEPLYTEGHEKGITNDIHKIRDEVDIVIVSMHWGDEFIQRPSPEEIRLARHIIDAGANLIIGHHPHVLRGIEKYNNGYIVYSLGNFVCDMVWDESLRTSLIFECKLTPNGIKDVKLVPVYINNDFQPEQLAGKKAQTVLSKIDTLSQQLNAETLSNFELLTNNYLQEADTAQLRNRNQSYLFFLIWFWKYPPTILIQQLVTFFRNRFHEITRADKKTSA